MNRKFSSVPIKPSKQELALLIFDGVKPTFTTALTIKHNFNWLNIDNEYKKEIKNRIKIMRDNPGLCAYDIKYEKDIFLALHKICTYLVNTYPSDFKFVNNNNYIKNCITIKIYPIYTGNPLKTLGCLITQDVNILLNFKDKDPMLIGSLTLYSVGWKPKERINFSLSKLHANVPGWKENKSSGARKVFSDLFNNKVSYSYRTNLFVQVYSKLTIVNRDDYIKTFKKRIFFKSLYLRREYQVFTPVSDDIVLFTVETHIVPLTSLNLNELKDIYFYFNKLKPNTYGFYHDFNIWGPTLAKHIKKLEKS